MLFAAGLVVASAVAGTAAQGLPNMSSQCQAAANAVKSGPAGTCLGMAKLLEVATTTADKSTIGPINNWLSSTCTQPACTDQVLDAAITNLTNGCGPELRLDANSVPQVKKQMLDWYSVGRQVACLKDSSDGDAFCVTKNLQSIQNGGPPLSIDTIVANPSNLLTRLETLPQQTACTPCNQAAYSLIRPKLNETDRNTKDQSINQKCGGNWATSSAPATIKQSANTAAPGSAPVKSGALSLGTGVAGIAAFALFGSAVLAF